MRTIGWSLIALLLGCGRIAFAPLDDGGGDGPRASCTSFGPWGTPQRIPEAATAGDDWEPALHPSGDLLVINTVNVTSDLFGLTVNGGVYGQPANLTAVNFPGTVSAGPAWSPAGDFLYFVSDRSAGADNLRLFSAAYSGGVFQSPVLELGLESVYVDAPALANDGLELYFDDNMQDQMGRIYRAERSSPTGTWTVTGLESQLDPGFVPWGWPTVSADSLTLYFEAGAGVPRIYSATRASVTDRFGPPVEETQLNAVGVAVSPTGLGDPDLSADGLSMRLGLADPMAATLRDVYVTTRACQ